MAKVRPRDLRATRTRTGLGPAGRKGTRCRLGASGLPSEGSSETDLRVCSDLPDLPHSSGRHRGVSPNEGRAASRCAGAGWGARRVGARSRTHTPRGAFHSPAPGLRRRRPRTDIDPRNVLTVLFPPTLPYGSPARRSSPIRPKTQQEGAAAGPAGARPGRGRRDKRGLPRRVGGREGWPRGGRAARPLPAAQPAPPTCSSTALASASVHPTARSQPAPRVSCRV